MKLETLERLLMIAAAIAAIISASIMCKQLVDTLQAEQINTVFCQA